MPHSRVPAAGFVRLRSVLRRLLRGSSVSPAEPEEAARADAAPLADADMLRGWHALLASVEGENRDLKDRLRATSANAARLEANMRAQCIEVTRFATALAAVRASQRPHAAPPPSVRCDLTDDYAEWLAATRPSDLTLRVQRDMARTMAGPLFSIIVPVYKLPLAILRATIDSVRAQTWDRWQLCVAHADADDAAARAWLEEIAETDPRIKLCVLANGGISANSNAALELATGEYIVLLDHDDLLEPYALFAIASLLLEKPETDLVYSDKDKTDAAGESRFEPLFKPEWSPEMMLTVNYLTHVNALRTSIVREIGGWRSATDGAQDWDLFLRFVRRAPRVAAIRDVLYRWRVIPSSVASGSLASKPYALRSQMVALETHLHALGVSVTYSADEAHATMVRPRFGPPRGTVAVVIADVERDDDSRAAAAARIAAACPSTVARIVVALRNRNTAFDDPRIAVVAALHDGGKTLDAALDAAGTDIAIVADAESTLPESGDWVGELTGPLQIPGVGLVGCLVLDPRDGGVLEAGLLFDHDGTLHAPRHFTSFGSPFWMRNFTAVGGFVFAARVADVRAAGGFAAVPAYPRRDVDLCLRIGRVLGLRIAYTPYVRVTARRLEPALAVPLESAGYAALAARMMFPEGDPHFHPALAVVDRVVRMRLPSRALPSEEQFTAEARYLAGAFDATRAAIEASRNPPRPTASGRPRRIAWIVPDFGHAHYGGIATILRFASLWKQHLGVEPVLVAMGRTPADVVRDRVVAAFPELRGIEVYRIASPADTQRLPDVDAAFATFWTTAYALLRWRGAGKRCYLVQDFEPSFYPAGTTAALVTATYRFGFEGVCNTVGVRECYAALGGSSTVFAPAVDPRVFHRHGRREGSRPVRIFAYMRPGHLRNGFELLALALRDVKKKFGDRVEIVSAGSEWDPATFALHGVVTNLGLLGYHATGPLYRSIDVGVVIMMTSHPSYLPLELMACGAAVVTNHNERTRWLLHDNENCLLAETTVAALAERIGDAVADAGLRNRISAAAADEVEAKYSDWDTTATDLFFHLFGHRNGVSPPPAKIATEAVET